MAKAIETYDALIVGGGVIGLSLAWELAKHEVKVCVVDRGELGKEASWAGAGMIPPGPDQAYWKVATPYEQLAGLSQRLQPKWHAHLLDTTGIDNEYRRCGALQLATTDEPAKELDEKAIRWRHLGIKHQQIDATALSDIEPALSDKSTSFTRAYHLPNEAQIRNPRHLRALITACQRSGVELRQGVEVLGFATADNQIISAQTNDGPVHAEKFCLTSGSWSGQVAAQLRIDLPVKPIRGQIVLLNGPSELVRRNINVGPRYLTPRRDGRILVGSTQEDVGFQKTNTEAEIAKLMSFAASLSTRVAELPMETSWAGLRPATLDGLPYLGPIPEFENGWLATGHFRAGLQLSPATAVTMRALMLGQPSPVDVSLLGLDR